MKKNIIVMSMLVFIFTLISLVIAVNVIQNFDSQSSNLNITFSGNENQTYNISIYRYANVSSAFMNLTGYLNYCYQESANTSNQTGLDGNCGLNYTGSYSTIKTGNWADDGVENQMYDGNWTNGYYSVSQDEATPPTLSFFINYSLPLGNFSSANWRTYTGLPDELSPNQNFTIPIHCINYNNNILELKMNMSVDEDSVKMWCKNITTYHYLGISPSAGAGGKYIMEEAIYWGFYPTNIKIFMNDTQIWNYTEKFNQTNIQTSDFSSTLNTALNGGACDCSDCILNDNNCTIPFIFHSNNSGIINTILNITWNESITPNITINEPIGEKGYTNISYNISVEENYLLDYCTYWVTRGASLEVANTSVSCSSQVTGVLYVSSIGTNYTFHFFTNDTSGNGNYSNSSFSTSSTAIYVAPPSTGGGGGTTTTQNKDWIMQVASGVNRFEIGSANGINEKRDLQFESYSTELRQISLSCVDVIGQICKYVEFESETFNLQPLQGTIQTQSFTIKIPEELEQGDYQFNIISSDSAGNSDTVTVFLNIGALGLPKLFLKKLGSSTSGGFPYSLIFFPILILTFIASLRLLKDIELKAVLSILISGVVSILIIIII